jgi:hypothetical protein
MFNRFMESVDLFGMPMQLKYRSRPAHLTPCGGYLTIVFYVIILLYSAVILKKLIFFE